MATRRAAAASPQGEPPDQAGPTSPGLLSAMSVAQLTGLIEAALERQLPPMVRVAGEISNCKPASAGHVYFTLKDVHAQIPAVLWKTAAQRLKFRLHDGMSVVVAGHVGVFAPQGRYQLYVERIEPVGVGALELAFRQLCDQLRAEGLFDPRRKRALPRFPWTIGLITSRDGAAVRDMVRTIRRRNPAVRVVLFSVPVQGPLAGAAIVTAIHEVHHVSAWLRPDVIILGRGGGSLEDLWAFNEEPVARSLADSAIPTIAAVGHEVDTTVCCLVADVRAATPTAGAELAVPLRQDLLDEVNEHVRAIHRCVVHELRVAGDRLHRCERSRVMQHPLHVLNTPGQRLDLSAERLKRAGDAVLAIGDRRLEAITQRLLRVSPRNRLALARQRVDTLADRLTRAIGRVLDAGQAQLGTQEVQLIALNPRGVLARGYSITRLADGTVVREQNQVQPGDVLVSELADGQVTSRAGDGPQTSPPRLVRPRKRKTAEHSADQMRLF